MKRTGKTCFAFNCNSRFVKGDKSVTFHRFPVDEKRRNVWIDSVKRADILPSKHTRLCSKHFEQDCFRDTSRRIWLKETAVPTIFDFDSQPAYGTKKRIVIDDSLSFSDVQRIVDISLIKKEHEEMDEAVTSLSSSEIYKHEESMIAQPTQKRECEVLADNTSFMADHECILAKSTKSSSHSAPVDLQRSAVNCSGGNIEKTPCASIPKGKHTRLKPKPLRSVGDYSPSDIRTASSARKYVKLVRETLATKNRSLKVLRNENSVLKHKIKSLEALCKKLGEEALLSASTSDVLISTDTCSYTHADTAENVEFDFSFVPHDDYSFDADTNQSDQTNCMNLSSSSLPSSSSRSEAVKLLQESNECNEPTSASQKYLFTNNISIEKEGDKLGTICEENRCNDDEFEYFAKSIALQLKNMPLECAVICKEKIERLMSNEY